VGLGKYAIHGKEFYLKEYECLRKEIELMLAEARSLERSIVVAVGATWGWLVDKSLSDKSRSDQLPKWVWFVPCLFAGLGAWRASGLRKEFAMLHEYIKNTENVFSSSSNPGGWEHFIEGKGWTAKSTFVFWFVLISATLIVAFYKLDS
jgi:hypothetical protein